MAAYEDRVKLLLPVSKAVSFQHRRIACSLMLTAPTQTLTHMPEQMHTFCLPHLVQSTDIAWPTNPGVWHCRQRCECAPLFGSLHFHAISG